MSKVTSVSLPPNALCYLYEDRHQKKPSCLQGFVYNAVISPHLSDCARKVRIVALTVLAAVFSLVTLGLGSLLVYKFVQAYKAEAQSLNRLEQPYRELAQKINENVAAYNEIFGAKKVTDLFKEAMDQILKIAQSDLKTALIMANLLPDIIIPQEELHPIDEWGFGTQTYTLHTLMLLRIVDTISEDVSTFSVFVDKDPQQIELDAAKDNVENNDFDIKNPKYKRDALAVLNEIRNPDVRAFMKSHYLASRHDLEEAKKEANLLRDERNESLRYAAYAIRQLYEANFDKDDEGKFKKHINKAIEFAKFVMPPLLQARLLVHISYFMEREGSLSTFANEIWKRVTDFIAALDATEVEKMGELVDEITKAVRERAAGTPPRTPTSRRTRTSTDEGDPDNGLQSAFRSGGLAVGAIAAGGGAVAVAALAAPIALNLDLTAGPGAGGANPPLAAGEVTPLEVGEDGAGARRDDPPGST